MTKWLTIRMLNLMQIHYRNLRDKQNPLNCEWERLEQKRNLVKLFIYQLSYDFPSVKVKRGAYRG